MQSNVNGSDAALEGPAPPEVEVRCRPMRRRFTSEYKLAILQEADCRRRSQNAASWL
jgi:hypothetical protein